MEQIVIIGSGNLAWALARALKEIDHPPMQIYARNAKQGGEIAAMAGCQLATKPSELAKADLYIMAVSDRAIATVAGQLDFGDGVVAHTAGSVAIDAIPAKIRNRAVFYPMQTFTRGRGVDFSEIPVFIEGATARALDVVRTTAKQLSGQVVEMDSQQRMRIHVAAVFASNFTNYMYSVGELLVQEAGADFSILKPLILETAAKAASARSPVMTQTGPAARNDFQTKALHRDLLFDKPDLQNIYVNLSNKIWETSKKTSQK